MSFEHKTVNSLNNRPPRSTATDQADAVYNMATGVAAASGDLWAGYAADAGGNKMPQGKVLLELEATVSTAYVRFARTATTATTTANGSAVVVGVPRVFYIDPTKDLFLDVIAAGAASSLKWRIVGPIGERTRA